MATKLIQQRNHFKLSQKVWYQSTPVLKKRGSSSGCQGWINSLQFKMGNFITKMQLGRPDVRVNCGKRGENNADSKPSQKNIKMTREAEIKYLPEFPEGMDVA